MHRYWHEHEDFPQPTELCYQRVSHKKKRRWRGSTPSNLATTWATGCSNGPALFAQRRYLRARKVDHFLSFFFFKFIVLKSKYFHVFQPIIFKVHITYFKIVRLSVCLFSKNHFFLKKENVFSNCVLFKKKYFISIPRIPKFRIPKHLDFFSTNHEI